MAFISICVGATQRITLSVLARNPHKGPERKTRSGGGKECPREDRESQLTKESRREKSVWDSYPKKDTVGKRKQWEDGSRAVKRWVSIPSGFAEVSHKIHAHDSWQMHGELQRSVTNFLLLHLELTQVRVCSFVPFFHPLGCVLCVCNEMCNAHDRKALDKSLAMSSLVQGSWDRGGQPTRDDVT